MSAAVEKTWSEKVVVFESNGPYFDWLDAMTDSMREVKLSEAAPNIEEVDRFLGAGNPGPKMGHGRAAATVLASKKTADKRSMMTMLNRRS